MDQPHESSQETPIVSGWADMESWLVESLDSMPPVGVLDIGPAHVPDDEEDADCAQIHVLSAGIYLIRLSTTMMSTPLLGRHRIPRAALDTWFHDDRFTDSTHGYLITRSSQRIAEITVTWFRDRCRFADPTVLGCSYTEPVELPRPQAGRRRPPSQGCP